MNIASFLPVILIVFTLWLLGLSFIFFKILSHYNRLVKKANGGNLEKALDKILENQALEEKEVEGLKEEITRIDSEGRLNLKRFGLLRYNPFNETGGDQSFSLAVLNGKGVGFVITGLHARDRTRVYVKPVEGGESKMGLSQEEKRAIKIAVKQK